MDKMESPKYRVTCINAISMLSIEKEREFEEECNANNGAVMYDYTHHCFVQKEIVRVGAYKMMVAAE